MKGWIRENQNPVSLLTPDGRELFDAYRLMKEYHLFPVEGGQAAQTSKFLLAVNLCDTVHTVYAERKLEMDKEAEKLEKRRRLIHLPGE